MLYLRAFSMLFLHTFYTYLEQNKLSTASKLTFFIGHNYRFSKYKIHEMGPNLFCEEWVMSFVDDNGARGMGTHSKDKLVSFEATGSYDTLLSDQTNFCSRIVHPSIHPSVCQSFFQNLFSRFSANFAKNVELLLQEQWSSSYSSTETLSEILDFSFFAFAQKLEIIPKISPIMKRKPSFPSS